jgi:F-type H+-transporting ATPase subunit epsilon
MAELTLNVVTPEGSLYEGEASFVAAPGADGELGILPRHAALIAHLGIGPLRVKTEKDTLRFAVRGGFLQVMENAVTLLATQAVKPEELDRQSLVEEKEALLAELQHPSSDEAYDELMADRRWVEVREALL